jgi:hypothetical protein
MEMVKLKKYIHCYSLVNLNLSVHMLVKIDETYEQWKMQNFFNYCQVVAINLILMVQSTIRVRA